MKDLYRQRRARFHAFFEALPLIAILRGIAPDTADGVDAALVREGFGLIETPLNSPEPFDTIAAFARRRAEDALTGAGTVLTAEAVDAVAEAGGEWIVAPNFNPDVVRRARERGLVSAPGIMTPSEAFAALATGADALKLFPAEMIPPAAVKAMRAVLPKETRLVIVGGVTPETMKTYLQAGADGFGIGSALYKPGDGAEAVAAKARAFAAAYREAKGSLA